MTLRLLIIIIIIIIIKKIILLLLPDGKINRQIESEAHTKPN